MAEPSSPQLQTSASRSREPVGKRVHTAVTRTSAASDRAADRASAIAAVMHAGDALHDAIIAADPVHALEAGNALALALREAHRVGARSELVDEAGRLHALAPRPSPRAVERGLAGDWSVWDAELEDWRCAVRAELAESLAA
jgi:hypothetical protein